MIKNTRKPITHSTNSYVIPTLHC